MGKSKLEKFKLHYEDIGKKIRFPVKPKRKYNKRKGNKK